MPEKSFEEAVQAFRAVAREHQVNPSVVESVVKLHAAPIADAEAAKTAYRWFNAPAGDPIHQLTLNDLTALFAKAKGNWEAASAAASEIATDVLDPANLERVAEASRKFDWAASRARIAQHVDPAHALARRGLQTLDGFIALAQKGAMREAVDRVLRRHTEAARDNAAAYAQFARGGNEMKGKNWDDYYGGTADGLMAGFGLGGCIVAAGVAGPLAATVGVTCAVMSGVGFGNMIRNAWW